MVKKVVHISDIHFRTFKRHDEYREQCIKLFDYVDSLLEEYDKSEIRIVITGDLVHQKITISNELSMILSWFLIECANRAKTIVIPGNHDLLEKNIDRLDSITPIVEMLRNPNIIYYKTSVCDLDDNIVWCPYSIIEENKRPDIESSREDYGNDKTYIGLYHGPITGSKTDLGFEIEGGDLEQFDGCDIVMLGDIHKRNHFRYKNIPISFASSLIQQDFGESAGRGHGFLVWDIQNRTFEEVDLPTQYGFYTFSISSIDDIENESEILIN